MTIFCIFKGVTNLSPSVSFSCILYLLFLLFEGYVTIISLFLVGLFFMQYMIVIDCLLTKSLLSVLLRPFFPSGVCCGHHF